ncbi:MAG: hypothetical protein ACOX1P_05250 [Thermoguttaceae bacterium]|jgi:hypothetical protein
MIRVPTPLRTVHVLYPSGHYTAIRLADELRLVHDRRAGLAVLCKIPVTQPVWGQPCPAGVVLLLDPRGLYCSVAGGVIRIEHEIIRGSPAFHLLHEEHRRWYADPANADWSRPRGRRLMDEHIAGRAAAEAEVHL